MLVEAIKEMYEATVVPAVAYRNETWVMHAHDIVV